MFEIYALLYALFFERFIRPGSKRIGMDLISAVTKHKANTNLNDAGKYKCQSDYLAYPHLLDVQMIKSTEDAFEIYYRKQIRSRGIYATL